MSGRIYLANVGANASHRFSSPIFPDGTFEFIPIPEDQALDGPHAVRYRDLKSFNNPDQELKGYVPKRLWDWPAHNDPQFETFTYGDNCETSPRAASLKRIEEGDFLFFLARLTHWVDGKATGEHGFYLIGFLEIEDVLKDVRSHPERRLMSRFGDNAHIRRGLCNPNLWDRFWVFAGSRKSRRFKHAVPVTRALADQVFTTADGSPWLWNNGRSDLQVIGSYTRSCRCIIDPASPGHAERAAILWDWVARHRHGSNPPAI